jgi:hypothetical protein
MNFDAIVWRFRLKRSLTHENAVKREQPNQHNSNRDHKRDRPHIPRTIRPNQLEKAQVLPSWRGQRQSSQPNKCQSQIAGRLRMSQLIGTKFFRYVLEECSGG